MKDRRSWLPWQRDSNPQLARIWMVKSFPESRYRFRLASTFEDADRTMSIAVRSMYDMTISFAFRFEIVCNGVMCSVDTAALAIGSFVRKDIRAWPTANCPVILI